MIPKPAVEDIPVVHNETAVPAPLLAVPMQKEILVSTTTNDAPKTPDLTDFDDPLRSVQKYKAYFLI